VYLGAVVVVVSVMLHGITRKRAEAMRELVGVDRRTLCRWREWWVGNFPRTRLWKAVRHRFVPPVESAKLPASLLERFGETAKPGPLVAVLGLLAPLSAGLHCVVAF
jgi:hypothetical protein